MIFTFEIPGRPAPKGSRVSGVTRSGVRFNRESNPRVGGWMKLAVEHLDREALLQRWETVPKEVPLVLRVVFTFERPRKATYSYPPAGDLDKYVRAASDALVGGSGARGGNSRYAAQLPIISDDSQLVEIHAEKRYGASSSTRGTVSPA